MTRDLLWRGMLAGVLAAILATLFARIFAEPQVDLAIAFEVAHDTMGAMAHEPELVGRATQKGVGLLTAVTLYGSGVGGLFALVFAAAYGRLARIGPRSMALLLAVVAFVAIALVPALKYPPTPPAVGQHATVAFRTVAYFAMIALSLVTLVLAFKIRDLLADTGVQNAILLSIAAYIMIMAVVQGVLPAINEVPADYPATVLWDFRIASIGMQGVLWITIGVSFGMMAERLFRRR